MTPLWEVAFDLWHLGTKFTMLQARVLGVPVFGEIFAAPFGAMAGILYRASSKCFEADRLLLDLRRFWHNLEWGYLINDLIRRVFWWWDRLRSDPRGFVNDWITDLFPGWTSFRYDPRGYILGKIYERYPELRAFLQDPWDWLRVALEWRLGLGSGFFADPLGNIRGRIYNRYPQLRGLFENPSAWLRDQLVVRLGVQRDFLDDPTAWVWWYLREAIERNLQSHLDWLIRIVARTLENIWSMKT